MKPVSAVDVAKRYIEDRIVKPIIMQIGGRRRRLAVPA
jgi:hypothetical protein